LHVTGLDEKLKCQLQGWLRDKDENKKCQEGYQKRQRMHQENQEDMEAKADSGQADRFSNQRPLKKIKK
jgi:hypothetical protein